MGPAIPYVIANYQLREELGAGYSGMSRSHLFSIVSQKVPGSIWRARNIHNDQIVALKLQDVDHECPTNRYERNFYHLLSGLKGIPTLYASGVEGPWDYLAIDLLGPSLQALFKGKEVMDLRSVCCVAMQVVSILDLRCRRI